jgi:hypothetical protein
MLWLPKILLPRRLHQLAIMPQLLLPPPPPPPPPWASFPTRGMLPLQTPPLAMLPLALPPLLQVLGPGLSGSPRGMPLSPLLTLVPSLMLSVMCLKLVLLKLQGKREYPTNSNMRVHKNEFICVNQSYEFVYTPSYDIITKLYLWSPVFIVTAMLPQHIRLTRKMKITKTRL